MNNKNIAIINTVSDKSTGKICFGLFNYFIQKEYSVYFCYGYGKKLSVKNTYRINYFIERYIHAILARLTGLQGYFSNLATTRLFHYLKKNNIDTIYAASLHGYYLNENRFLKYVEKNSINFVYIMIDEYPYKGKCGYSADCDNYLYGCGNCPSIKEYPKSLFFDQSSKIFLMKKKSYQSIRNHSIFVGPEFVVKDAKKSPLMEKMKTSIVDESIDTDFYCPRNSSELKKILKIAPAKIVILCIAPSSIERKGTRYFTELARRFENDERYIFVHVGYTTSDIGLPKNYIPIGYISDQEILAQYYSIGDLFVFPSLLDTMPNACLEALSCGVPLLCFNTSGMPYLGDESVMTLVEAKNVDEMEKVVRNTGKLTDEKRNLCRGYALRRYSSKDYYNKLEAVLNLIAE